MQTTLDEVGPYKVFMSYSSRDWRIAEWIKQDLEAVGAEVWIDEREVESGRSLLDQILTGIHHCEEVVVLISPYSTRSKWVPIEIGAALGQRKQVTPILCHAGPEALSAMSGIRAVELNRLQGFCSELKKRIDRWRSKETESHGRALARHRRVARRRGAAGAETPGQESKSSKP